MICKISQLIIIILYYVYNNYSFFVVLTLSFRALRINK